MASAAARGNAKVEPSPKCSPPSSSIAHSTPPAKSVAIVTASIREAKLRPASAR